MLDQAVNKILVLSRSGGAAIEYRCFWIQIKQ